MTPEVAAILRRIEAALAKESSPRVLNGVEALLEREPTEAALILWAKFSSVEDPYFRRVLSYAVAKTAASQPRHLWGAIVSYVVSLRSDDEATLINTLSALQLYEEHDDILVAILAPGFGAFAVQCARAGSSVADALAELVTCFAEREVLTKLLSRSQAQVVREYIEDGDALEILDLNEFPETLPDARPRLRSEAKILGDAAQTPSRHLTKLLLSHIEVALESYASREQAAALDGIVEEIALSGSDPARGRLSVETFGKLIHEWKTVIQLGAASLAPDAEPTLQTYLLTPARGSFVLRFLVTADRLDPVTEIFERVARISEDPERMIPASELSQETKNHVTQFLEILAQKRLSATLSHTDARFFRRSSRRIISNKLTLALRNLRQTQETSVTSSVVGVLEGASYRNGSFEISTEEQGLVRGTVPRAQRRLLLQKVIGRNYVFEIDEKITVGATGDTKRNWILVQVSPVADEVVPMQDQVAVLPQVITSADVPQQDRLDRIVAVVRLVAEGVDVQPTRLQMADTPSSQRHIDYMRHGAKVLGLLASDGTLTTPGRQLAQLPESRVLDFLSVQFELSVVGRLWKRWADANDLYELNPESSVDFLVENQLSPSMARRRGRTLRRWLDKFKQHGALAAEL